jgi:hypothetical protein
MDQVVLRWLYDSSSPTTEQPAMLSPLLAKNIALPFATVLPTDSIWKYAFTDDDTIKNNQEPMLYTIPELILKMFKNRVYIPMSMFLIDSMEHVCIDQDLKTHKAQGMRIINASNFVNEKSLSYQDYSQAYHNFLCCMELCMPPGSMLPQAWDHHFLGASQDQHFTNFRIFILMDIRMRQQLVDKPFKHEPSSNLYRDAYKLASAKVK